MARLNRKCATDMGIPDTLIDELFGKDADGIINRDAFMKAKSEKVAKQIMSKREVKLQAVRDNLNKQHIDQFEGTPKEALASLVGKTVTPVKQLNLSMEVRENAIKGQLFQEMSETIKKYQPKIAGLVNTKADQEDLVRELFDNKTGNGIANRMAGELKKVFEQVRTMFNAAGGRIKELEDWGLPQAHNPSAMNNQFDKWDALFRKTVDFDRSGLDESKSLKPMFDAILGLKDDANLPDARGKGQSFTAKFSNERKIHFQDADSWLEYQKEFGSQDFYGTIIDHITTMSNAIARLETFGPNPDLGFKRLVEYANLKSANEQIKGSKGALSVAKASTVAERMYNTATGKVGVSNPRMAKLGSNIRSGVVTALSGKIMLAQVTDIPLSTWRGLYNGIGATRSLMIPFKLIKNMLHNSDVESAAKLGYVAESMLGHFNRVEGRFDESNLASSFIRNMSEFMFRGGGVTRWTESAQIANVMELNHALSSMSDKSWEFLNPNIKRMLGRYGITGVDWEVIALSVVKTNGIDGIDTSLIKSIDLKRKVMGMFSTEAKMAVPEPGYREASIFRQNEAGSLMGELARTVGVFKSFPITTFNNFISPVLNKHSTMGDKALLALFGLIILPAVGYMASSAKQLSSGQKPQDPFKDEMSFAKTYGSSMLQGGGLGILGDLVFSSENRFGGGALESAAGPVVMSGMNIKRLVETMGGSGLEGNEKAFDKAAVQSFDLLVNYTLPMLNLWYVNLLSEKYIENPIREAIDPRYESRKRRTQRTKQKEGSNSGIWFDTL